MHETLTHETLTQKISFKFLKRITVISFFLNNGQKLFE